MKFTGIAAAAIAAMLVTGAASAATLSVVGSYDVDNTVTGNSFGYNDLQFISGDLKDNLSGLSLSGPATVTYTYIGKEAGNTNFARNGGVDFFTTASVAGATYVVSQLAAGLLDFSLGTLAPISAIGAIANNGTALPASVDYAIAFKKLSDTSFIVLFDDIAGGDRDFDDLVMQVDVAAIPVPAAGFLLIGAIGGLGVVARRRKA